MTRAATDVGFCKRPAKSTNRLQQALPCARVPALVLLALLVNVVGLANLATAAPQDQELIKKYKVIQQECAQKIRSGVEADRIEVLIQLRDYPVLPAARMAIGALDDANLEVREEAHETIVGYHTNSQICKHYLSLLRADSRRTGWTPVSYSLLFGLAMSPDEELQQELIKLIDVHASARPNNLEILNAVIDGLGTRGDEDALSALRTMGHSDLIAADFGIRRGLVQAVISIRTPEAVDTLLELLPNIDGEVRGDAIKYLSALSNERLGENVEGWNQWWKLNREGFQFPNALETPKDIMEAFAAEGTSTYYDLPIFARRLVFIIDCSASMNDRGRMTAAKQELIDAINSLNEETYFNIVAFNTEIDAWQGTLQQANTPGKTSASMWVNSLQPINYTNSFGALRATFGFKNLEAIYFVSDGAPTAGEITDKEQIVKAVHEGNRTRRVTIYTIGIEPDEDREGTFEKFLKDLAEENYGLYRPVGDFRRNNQ